MSLPLAVLCSGEGTNLQAILDACAARRLDASVRLVVCNVPDARAVARAEAAGVPCLVLSHRAYSSRDAYDAALTEALRDAGVELVVLAGFLRILTERFLSAYPDRVINIHPSLLPAFPGLDAVGQALAYGSSVTGCTVHLLDTGMDTGPILAQAVVSIRDDDTRESLAERLRPIEHALLIEVIDWFAAGRVQVSRGAAGARPRVLVRDRQRSRGLAGSS
jgi:phosphoribosylglycinamide formyltransferase-1